MAANTPALDGDGIFPAPITFTGPARADESVSEDFDNDGILDVAIVNGVGGGSGNVSVYHGSGNGSFSLIGSRTVGNFPQGIAAADFDGDGHVDVATANNGAGTASVLFNNGDGTFAPALNLAGGIGTYDVATGDFNGDGRADLAVIVNDSPGYVRRWLGNGDGTFGPAADTAVGDNPMDLAVADVNNDGRADLATANDSSGGASTSVLLGTAGGGFAVVSGATLGGNAKAVAFGDFSGDGRPDLAVGTDAGGGSYHVLLGNGTGAFASSAAQGQVGTVPQKIAAGDFNNDGKLDLVSGDGSNVRVLVGDGSGGLAATTPVSAPSSAFTVTPGDYNGDGKLDVISSRFSGSTVNVLLNQTPSPASPLGTVSGGVLTCPAGTVTGVGKTGGSIRMTSSDGVMQYVSASAVRSIVATGSTPTGFPLTISSDLGRSGGMRRVSFTAPAGTTISTASQHLDALNVAGGSFRMVTNSFNTVLRVRALNISTGGTVDLIDSDLIYDYSDATPIDALRTLLASGRNGGNWNGTGLTSFSAAGNPAKTTGLGYLEATDFKTLNGQSATFAGEAVDDSALLVRHTYYGDADLDRGVSINDFNFLSANFGGTGKLWAQGDFDYDGGVSINDFNQLSANFGKTWTVPTPAPASKGVAPAKAKR